MTVLMPLLALFIVGSAWGLSDAGTDLPMLIEAPTASLLDGAYLVLYVASVFTLLSATIGAVLVSFDSISHGRGSGELEVLLAQPIPRREVANGLILGHWAAITLPTLLLTMLAIIVTARRTGGWPPLWTIALLLIATSLLLLWYVLIQILASAMRGTLVRRSRSVSGLGSSSPCCGCSSPPLPLDWRVSRWAMPQVSNLASSLEGSTSFPPTACSIISLRSHWMSNGASARWAHGVPHCSGPSFRPSSSIVASAASPLRLARTLMHGRSERRPCAGRFRCSS